MMSKNENIETKKKTRKKIDKSQIAIKVVAVIVTLAMVIPVVASTIFYIMGE